MSNKTRVTSMRMSEEVRRKIKLIAATKGITQSQLMNEYLQKGIDSDIDLVKSLLE